MRSTICLIISLLWISHSFAQNADGLRQNIIVNKTSEYIVLDGELNENAWIDAGYGDNFWQNFPYDSLAAFAKTEIYFTYDDNHLYVGIKCFSKSNEFIIPSLKRDYSFFGSDNISVFFDTYNDQSNAFLFGVNPMGVRREALLSNGGRQRGDFAMSWDNKWNAEAKVYDDYWIAEMSIPFKTLRYEEGATTWRMQSYRNDTQHNEVSAFVPIPRNRILMDMSYMSNIVFEEPLKKPGSNFSVIPYLAGAVLRDFEDETETKADVETAIGGDAKIAVSSAMNLDLTINPDFSQVEVDRQVTNLDRFEIFFPERRQFFLENADLFGSFGATRVNPFFSRRIGIALDTTTETNVQNSILYGARLSGKINPRLRIGLLNMQAQKQERNDLPGFNYTVAALEQNIFKRSSLAFIFVNKDAINAEDFGATYNSYNRTAGFEWRIASEDNRLNGKVSFQGVSTPEDLGQKFSHFTQLIYTERKFRLEWAHMLIGNGFNPEVGFVPRKDIFLYSPEVSLFFYPKKGPLTQSEIGFDASWIYQMGNDLDSEVFKDFSLAEWKLEPFWDMSFKNNARAGMKLLANSITLAEDFDPTRIQEDSIFLLAGTKHNFINFEMNYRSDPTKIVTFRVETNTGSFYSGTRLGIAGDVGLRFQPYGSIGLSYSYNYIKLEEPFVPAHLWLVGPRIDLTFSKNVFLTTFIQYNSQSDNLNINARFQWRFQPVSDFFLVYTDNYLTDPFDQFSVRNRAFVAKITYWLNL